MSLETILSYDWGLMLPEFIVLIGALVISLLDLFSPLKARTLSLLGVSVLGGALVSLITLIMSGATGSIINDTFLLDGFAKSFKIIILLGAALIMAFSSDELRRNEIEDRGEYVYLFLSAVLGAMVMISSGDLITMFVGLELLSISSYILVAMRKKRSKAGEGAIKYIINGGIASAVALFGMSYLYGLSGTVKLNMMVTEESYNAFLRSDFSPLILMSCVLIFVGMSFKIASAPFHMWAPDVYQSAATPVTAFLSVVSKTAGFVLLLRLFLSVFVNIRYGLFEQPVAVLSLALIVVGIFSAITILVGNIAALKQQNVKRLFAYSSIAHAGYILTAIVGLSAFTLESIWFYLLVYTLMTTGAFVIVHIVTRESGDEEISAFSGLGKKHPVLAVLFSIFILSLAGIPGTAGFIAKLGIFNSLIATGESVWYYVLGAVLFIGTVLSYVYYFGLMKVMFVSDKQTEVAKPSSVLLLILGICAVTVIALGIMPDLALDVLRDKLQPLQGLLK